MAIKNTTPFNFDELYSELQTKFYDAGYDVSEGSNVSQLCTAMAYLTSMLNVNTAVNVNETLLPYATQRHNILSDARVLGYEIKHKTSFIYELTIELGVGNHSIQPFTEFKYGTKTYYYMGKPIEYVGLTSPKIITLSVKEGLLHKFADNPDSLVLTIDEIVDDLGNIVPQTYVDIPLLNVEENGIEAYLTYYDNVGNYIVREEWSQSKQFMVDAETTLNKEFIRLDNIDLGTPRIHFKLANVGTDLKSGSIVELNVLTTNGELGYIENTADVQGIIHNIPNATITACSLVTPGTEEESTESVKENAPKFHNSANRAVTKIDYETFCNRQTVVENSMVWGGDDEFPKAPGHVWFSFKPFLEKSLSVTNYGSNNNFVAGDSMLYTLTRENWGDIQWDYTLDPVNDQVAYDAQVLAAKTLYNHLYLEDRDIRSFDYDVDGRLLSPGIWDDLDNYKIPSIEFHNRHPIYLDFEYDIRIPKYNISVSKAKIHGDIFNAVDNFFSGAQDNIKMETFEVEYFGSSLDRRIDNVLSDETGFDMTTYSKLYLTKYNVSREIYPVEYRDIFIPLAVPFEKYFDNSGNLVSSVLPSIDTNDFVSYGTGGFRIYTDWDGLNGTNLLNEPVIIAPIRVEELDEVTVTVADGNVGTTPTITVNYNIIPDDPTMMDFNEATDIPANYTFNRTTVTIDPVTPLALSFTIPYSFGGGVNTWRWDENNKNQVILELQDALIEGDKVIVESHTFAGTYTLFNSFKKSILINLHVNAEGWTDDIESNISEPKSYLTTPLGDQEYMWGNYYVTSKGYKLSSTSQVGTGGDVTGDIVQRVSESHYKYTPIKMDLFNKHRYLNLVYNTLNFPIKYNILPRFKQVIFQQGL